jgi:hypothetical protein
MPERILPIIFLVFFSVVSSTYLAKLCQVDFFISLWLSLNRLLSFQFHPVFVLAKTLSDLPQLAGRDFIGICPIGGSVSVAGDAVLASCCSLPSKMDTLTGFTIKVLPILLSPTPVV